MRAGPARGGGCLLAERQGAYGAPMADFEYVFTTVTEPADAELRVEGELPPGLDGTFYAIGGTGNRVGDARIHGFDAHGRVTAFRLQAGKTPSLRARMVDTPLWRTERERQEVVKRRIFTNKPARWSNLLDVDLGNNAWHNVVPWGDAVVATNDPGFFLLDPETLDTRGPAPLAPKKGATFTPMPRRDPSTGRLVVFEERPGPRDTLIVRELDERFAVVSEKTYKLPRGAAVFHDVAFTERFYVVVQWSSVALPQVLWGARPFSEALRFSPSETPTAHLLPRAGGPPISVPLPGGRLHFHFWNAFERDGKLLLDAIGYAGRVSFAGLYPPEARAALGVRMAPSPRSASVRYTIDPVTGTARDEPLTDVNAEAPEVRADRRGRPYRYGWAPTRGGAGDEEDPDGYLFFHALARHDFDTRQVTTWDAGPHAFVSPAAFVARPQGDVEDDGWVLAVVQDARERRSTLAVFDARHVARGPLARLHAPVDVGLVGMISHVSFASSGTIK